MLWAQACIVLTSLKTGQYPQSMSYISNVFATVAKTAVNAYLHIKTAIPIAALERVAGEIPGFIVQADSVLGAAASGFAKLEHVVVLATPLIPSAYAKNAASVLSVLTTLEYFIGRVQSVEPAVAAVASEVSAGVAAASAPGSVICEATV